MTHWAFVPQAVGDAHRSEHRKKMHVHCHVLFLLTECTHKLYSFSVKMRSHAEIILWNLNRWISRRGKGGLFLWYFIQKKTRYSTCTKIYIKDDSIYEVRNNGHGWRNYKNISHTVTNFPLWSCLQNFCIFGITTIFIILQKKFYLIFHLQLLFFNTDAPVIQFTHLCTYCWCMPCQQDSQNHFGSQ